MAHVLLPCDLPSWDEVQKLLLRLRTSREGDKVAQIMAQVHEASSVSLDPEDSGPVLGHPGFQKLKTFLCEEKLGGKILSDMADWASRLPNLKPPNGIHYSLRTEEKVFYLKRPLAASLLANAFFSTFPRRKAKTHPTLQDFSMADFFSHLDRDSHRKKLRALLRYFEGLEPEPDGAIQFTRKVFRGPSLPGWLCSERPLVPLVVRPQGSIDEAEPWVFRGCSCSSAVGGNVLAESTSQESSLFFEFPELLTCLCFLENLADEEALIVEGVRAPNTQEVNFCFVDIGDCKQLDDRSLLRYLNKAAAAFAHEPRRIDRRRTPDGEESLSDAEGRWSLSESREGMIDIASERLVRAPGPKVLSAKRPMDKSLSKTSSKFSMRTASESSAKLDDEYYTADEESEPGDTSISESTGDRPLLKTHRLRAPSSTSAASNRSIGFVLAHNSEDEDEEMFLLNQTRHERLEDFRRRIRRRTRRKLSSRRSSSYSSGCSSSDMEDITEDPEEMNVRPVVTIRPACSEPNLVACGDPEKDAPPPWVNPDAFLSLSGKQLAATCSSASRLKSYSHDGVRPNLPVPFKARFRVRKGASEDGSQDSDKLRSMSCTEDKDCMASRCPVAVAADSSQGDSQLRALVLWLAASMSQLPALILYTMNEPSLKEVVQVYNQVLSRHWTIGDLACEVLRFCRNQIMPGHRTGKYPHLFGQLLPDKSAPKPAVQTRTIFTEESLD